MWEWCRNQQEEEEEEEDEEELGAPKQLCSVRSTHNSVSNTAPKMTQTTPSPWVPERAIVWESL